METLKSKSKVGVAVNWVVKERSSGLWVPKRKFKNLLTTYGLTAYASAPSGVYTPPVYLVIDQAGTTLTNTAPAGSTSISLSSDPTLGGDTQLVLGPGTAAQETVTFTAKAGSGPYTFTLSAGTINIHNNGDLVVRAPTIGDTIASVISEAQFDPTNFPNQRSLQVANYSPAAGQNTMQFFFSGTTVTNVLFTHVGLADTPTVGTGNLHNYAALGYLHNNTNDVEIDVNWTLTGM